MSYSDLKVCDDGDVLVPIKSKLEQFFCKHDYCAFDEPIDWKKNPRGFVSLNAPNVIWVCKKCGKHRR